MFVSHVLLWYRFLVAAASHNSFRFHDVSRLVSLFLVRGASGSYAMHLGGVAEVYQLVIDPHLGDAACKFRQGGLVTPLVRF